MSMDLTNPEGEEKGGENHMSQDSTALEGGMVTFQGKREELHGIPNTFLSAPAFQSSPKRVLLLTLEGENKAPFQIHPDSHTILNEVPNMKKAVLRINKALEKQIAIIFLSLCSLQDSELNVSHSDKEQDFPVQVLPLLRTLAKQEQCIVAFLLPSSEEPSPSSSLSQSILQESDLVYSAGVV
jgi:hypothetical protein